MRLKRDIVQNIFSVLLKSFAWIFIRFFCCFIKSTSIIIRSCLLGSLERIDTLGIICAPVMFCWYWSNTTSTYYPEETPHAPATLKTPQAPATWCVSLWCFLMDVCCFMHSEELCALVNKPSGASAGASDLKY